MSGAPNNKYIVIGRHIRITGDEVQIWRKLFCIGRPRLVCKAPLAACGINTWHYNYFQTPCGRFGPHELGLDFCELSHLLGMSRLEYSRAEAIRHSDSTVRCAGLFWDRKSKEFTTNSGATVYPFSAVLLSKDGTLVDKFTDRSLVGISHEESEVVRSLLQS